MSSELFGAGTEERIESSHGCDRLKRGFTAYLFLVLVGGVTCWCCRSGIGVFWLVVPRASPLLDAKLVIVTINENLAHTTIGS